MSSVRCRAFKSETGSLSGAIGGKRPVRKAVLSSSPGRTTQPCRCQGVSMLGRTHPVTSALSVARALLELATDAVNDGLFPLPMAVTMSRAAREAAGSLGLFIVARGPLVTHKVGKALDDARVDLEALAELAELVCTHDLTPANTVHLALAMRYTAEQTVNRLTQAESSLT